MSHFRCACCFLYSPRGVRQVHQPVCVGEGRCVIDLRGEVLIVEWEKNEYSLAGHLELLGNVSGHLKFLVMNVK